MVGPSCNYKLPLILNPIAAGPFTDVVAQFQLEACPPFSR